MKATFYLAILISIVLISLVGGSTGAEMFIYPAKGQSAEQQQKVEFESQQWSVQQTGEIVLKIGGYFVVCSLLPVITYRISVFWPVT